jgi:prepilin-type N-terminal cleavage/methylation domain-containing protein
MIPVTKNNRGFTLVELMIAMVIGLIIMASIFQVFRSHQKAQTAQQLVVDMLQNARASMTLMKREIRMAGHAPAATDGQDNDADGNNDESDDSDYPGGFPRFLAAKRGMIQFTMDFFPNPDWCKDGVDNDGDANIDEVDECFSNGNTTDLNENITYSLNGTTSTLERTTITASETKTAALAYDIEAVAFAYAYDADPSDDDDNLAVDAGGNVIWAYDLAGFNKLDYDIAAYAPPITGPVDLDTAGGRSIIRAVKIWLLARTASPVADYADTQTYQLADQTIGPGTYDPRYKRTLLTATVYCRNLRN